MLRLALLLILVAPAYAGLDCDENEAIKDLEAFAKTKVDAKINDPNHDWSTTLGLAKAMDVAGIDRVVVSDHVVFHRKTSGVEEHLG